MPKVAETTLLSKAILLLNKQAGPTVFQSGNTEVVWEGAGDPNGMDLQAIPLAFLEDLNFFRILNKGVLELFDAPDDVAKVVEEQLNNPVLNRQSAAWRAKQEERSSSAVSAIQHTTRNDYVTTGCIGPSTRGPGNCGVDVPVREFGGASKPPLCNKHEDLAKFCTEIPNEIVVDGKEGTVWRLAQVEARR
jgi:hypothetical protein